MTIENKSEFLSSQEDVCELRPPKEKEKDKVCPTCIPDENAAVPVWWELDRPFLNKKTCEYSISVVINEYGKTHTVGDLAEVMEQPEYIGGRGFELLKRGYVKPGLRMMLQYYNKMISDEIICANPPKEPIEGETRQGSDIGKEWDKCGELFDPVTDVASNVKALEVYARVPEFRFTAQNDSGILQVLVTIPAFVFDKSPDQPDLPEVDTDTKQIRLKGDKLKLMFMETISALRVFSSYQSYFYQTENGNLFFENNQKPFYLNFTINRIDTFYNRLEKLIEDNGFRLHGSFGFSPKAHEVLIVFDKTDEDKPFTIKTIKAKEKGCRFKKLKKGLKGANGFLKYANQDQTMLGYVSKLDVIHPKLTARETPPWLDFVLQFTYPKLAIDFGSANKFKDSRPDMCLSDMNQISDFILKEVLSFSKSFSYRLNKANCLSMYGKEYMFKRTPADFNEEEAKKNPNPPSLKFDKEAFKEKTFKGKMKYLNEYVRKKYDKEKSEKIEQKDDIIEALKDFKNLSWTGTDTLDKLKNLVNLFNPCSFQDFMKTLLKCLFRGMKPEEMYLSFIKATLGNMAAEGLEIVIQALPADKQEEIRKLVEEEFKDMPAPWEDSWTSGDFTQARENRQTEIIADRIEASGGAHDLKSKVSDMATKLKYYGFSQTVEVLITNKDTPEALETPTTPIASAVAASPPVTDPGSSTDVIDEKLVIRQIDIMPPEEEMRKIIGDIQSYVSKDSAFFTEELEKKKQEIQSDINNIMWEKVSMWEDELASLKQEVMQELTSQQGSLEVLESKEERILDLETLLRLAKDDIDDLKKELDSLSSPNNRIEKAIFRAAIAEVAILLDRIEGMRGTELDLQRTLDETAQYENWNMLSEEEQQEMIAEQADKSRFAKLRPDDPVQYGKMSKAIGNVQKAITKAYVDAIIKSAEIQQIMRAFDNLPGSKIIASFIAKFKCPKTHFLYPPIDSFLKTLTLNPCANNYRGPFLPSINQLPKLSWDLLKNLVDVFIEVLKITLKQAFAALMAKLAQIIDTTLCALIGGQNPFQTKSLMEVLGKQECKESDILKAAGAVTEGSPPSDEEYAKLGKAMSNAGPLAEMKRALTGNENISYFANVAKAVETQAPAFASTLGNTDSIRDFFAMASGLLSDEQRQAISDEVNEAPLMNVPTNKCLTNAEAEEYENNFDAAFASLPANILAEYKDLEADRLRSNADQVMDIVLNGPTSVLSDVLDKALDPTVDPDCVDVTNSVGAVMKKAKETKSFKSVRAGIFSRTQKAFIDDTIKWTLFDPFDPPGILGQILGNTGGNTLNYYNWYTNLINSIPIFGDLFPEADPFPETIGILVRDKFIENIERYKADPTFRSVPSITLDFSTEGIDEEPFVTKVRLQNSNAEGVSNFPYLISIESPEFSNLTMEATDAISEDVKKLMGRLRPLVEGDSGTYRTKMMKALMKKSWSEFSNVNITNSDANNVINGINNMLFDNLFPKLLSDRFNPELPSQGFKYGYKPQEITRDDLTYVAPDGSDYNFEESERILGRSKTSNPRVQFLDPAKHGGTYSAPFYNILAEKKEGWSQFAKTIVSTIEGCDKPDSNFMFFQNIMDTIEKEEAKIKPDERLQLAPDCVLDRPFDKIASPSTLATISGVITATIRMHVIDYMLRTFSVNAGVSLNFDRNYNKIISKTIAQKMRDTLSEQSSIFASTYERGVYWLLFLEQAVQTVRRRIDAGDMESTDIIEDAMSTINEAQKSYISPTYSDVFGDIKDQGVVAAVTKGSMIAAFGLVAPSILLVGGATVTLSSAFQLRQLKLVSKISTIHDVEEQCMVALESLIEEQLVFYSDVLSETLEPKPHIYDISKFFIGASRSTLKGKSEINAGLSDIEAPAGGKSNFDYGSIDSCVHNVNSDHPLSNLEIDSDNLALNGGLFFEKYLRIEEKNLQSMPPQRMQLNRAFITNRDKKLKGVVNIDKFKEFLANNAANIPVEANVSDFFGNAKIRVLEDGYDGSIGIKFGVRLCLVPPFGFRPFSNPSDEINSNNSSLANQEKNYILKSPVESSTTRYIFPICSYEKDIPDNKLFTYIDSNENFNQDLKCYIDELCLTPEFKLLFENIINIRKIPSVVSLYSYLNFYTSLGKGNDERNDSDDITQVDPSKLFNDTRHELRKLFVSSYKRKDFDPPDEEDEQSSFIEDLTRSALAKTVNNIFIGGDVPWWTKWKLKTKKLDKDGEPCGNQFGGLVNINKGE